MTVGPYLTPAYPNSQLTNMIINLFIFNSGIVLILIFLSKQSHSSKNFLDNFCTHIIEVQLG